MKGTVSRTLDELGRIVIPMHVRRLFGTADTRIRLECYLDEQENFVIINPKNLECNTIEEIIHDNKLTEHEKLERIKCVVEQKKSVYLKE